MTDDKRKFTRFPFNAKAELIVEDTRYEIKAINNLSIGGCLLFVTPDLKSETLCQLRIQLGTTGNDPAVEVEGSVIRCADSEVAIKFVRIDPENLFHLHNIARYNSSDPEKTEDEIKKNPGIC